MAANHAEVTARHSRVRRAAGLALIVVVALLAAVVTPAGAGAAGGGGNGKIGALGISHPGTPQQLTNLELARMRRIGITHVSLDVWWDFETPDANFVHAGAKTISDPELTLAIDQVRKAGLKVMLTPKLWCPACLPHGFTWRGRLAPSKPKDFFASYRAMVNHYADIAREHGVSMFFIGSELSEIQWAADEWREVARQVRHRFGGKLAYEVNWDVNDQVRFWDAVDVVGVSAYFPLTESARPSLRELKASWHHPRVAKYASHHWFDELRALAEATGKPLLFGEVGYPSAEYTARAPYDPNGIRKADSRLQVNAYRAVLETFQSQSWWMGAVWWEWYVTAGGPADVSYSPRDKPAETFLADWYRG